jgi:hypothetical protein
MLRRENMPPLWCNVCDSRNILPTSTDTGLYHAVAGHTVLPDGTLSDDYLTVVFAICPACKPVDSVKIF